MDSDTFSKIVRTVTARIVVLFCLLCITGCNIPAMDQAEGTMPPVMPANPVPAMPDVKQEPPQAGIATEGLADDGAIMGTGTGTLTRGTRGAEGVARDTDEPGDLVDPLKKPEPETQPVPEQEPKTDPEPVPEPDQPTVDGDSLKSSLNEFGIEGQLVIDHADAQAIHDMFKELLTKSEIFKKGLTFMINQTGTYTVTNKFSRDASNLFGEAPFGKPSMALGDVEGGQKAPSGKVLTPNLLKFTIAHEFGHNIQESHEKVFGDTYLPNATDKKHQGYGTVEHFGGKFAGSRFTDDVLGK